ncbi:ester cyclase [Streptomyces sp. NPDC058067]|uniref:ester cyclase n=1 Tax=Streptomyces sp. NPDC058067 TaxID=3346324 RepID=UPI0036E9F931
MGITSRLFWEAKPGTHEIEDQIAEGDKVVTRLTAQGVHKGDLPGIPATGKSVTMTATVIHRIENGKLAEKWSDKDLHGFLAQHTSRVRPGPPTSRAEELRVLAG